MLYWEFHEQSGNQAVREGYWKAIRLDVHEKGFHDHVELYNLEDVPSETNNVADKHPDVLNRMKDIMEQEHTTSKNFPFRFEAKANTDK